jgi:hypothetical protein
VQYLRVWRDKVGQSIDTNTSANDVATSFLNAAKRAFAVGVFFPPRYQDVYEQEAAAFRRVRFSSFQEISEIVDTSATRSMGELLALLAQDRTGAMQRFDTFVQMANEIITGSTSRAQTALSGIDAVGFTEALDAVTKVLHSLSVGLANANEGTSAQ